MTDPVTLVVITTAADPVDATVSERGAHRHPGHVRQHAGAGRPRGDISREMEALGRGEMTIDGDEPFCRVWVFSLMYLCVRLSELCGPYGDNTCRVLWETVDCFESELTSESLLFAA